MNYNSDLKGWGATGTEYPNAYSYQKDESPVDEWDNFKSYNLIKDTQHLIDVTNNDLLLRNGGSLLSDLTVGEFGLVGNAGSMDFGGTEITVDATIDVLQSLDVGGSIAVTGTVDGVDVGLLKTDHDTLSSSHNTLSSSHDALKADYDTHAVDSSFHHTRYSDTEARTAVDGSSISITGDAGTLDGLDSTDFARQKVGVEHKVYATKADVPATISKGETVYIDQDGDLYVEDGT